MEQQPLSLPRAARQFGVTARWLKQEAASGRVPCLEVGKSRFLFDGQSLARALRKRASKLPNDGGAQ